MVDVLRLARTRREELSCELAKFGELAHRWWDPDGEFRPLHQINPLRLDWIDGLARVAGKTVADMIWK